MITDNSKIKKQEKKKIKIEWENLIEFNLNSFWHWWGNDEWK